MLKLQFDNVATDVANTVTTSNESSAKRERAALDYSMTTEKGPNYETFENVFV